MYQGVQLAELTAHCIEYRFDFIIIGYVAGQNQRVFQRFGQFPNVFFQTLALVGKGQAHSRIRQSLSNGPGNAGFMGHTKDDTGFSGQQSAQSGLRRFFEFGHGHGSSFPARNSKNYP
jgi:hypothetical protein